MKTIMLLRCGKTERFSEPLISDDWRKKTAAKEIPGRMGPESDPENLRRVLDNLDVGAYVADMKTGEILYANPYTREVFGNVEGRICWQVLQEGQNGPCPFCTNRQLVNERGEPARVVLREIQNTRTKRWYECRDSAVYWTDGRVVRLEIATDITERKRREEGLIRKMKLEAMSVLAEDIVHDFNGLLSLSMGYLSLARLHMPPSHPVLELLDRTEETFIKTGELCSRLFTLIGEDRFCLRRVSLDALLLDSVRLFLKDSQLKSAFILAERLWTVRIDENRIRQVIFHLLQNARQAMPEGGQVTIRAENVFLKDSEKGELPSGAYVCWSIEDRGIGIDPDDLPRIFDPGFANWPGDCRRKSGWGLAACRSIISRHQGHIECRSKPGVGTTVTLYLPAEKDS